MILIDFCPAVIVGQNFFVRIAFFSHAVSSVLTHADTVT